MTSEEFTLLINVLFAGLMALACIIGYRVGSAWQ